MTIALWCMVFILALPFLLIVAARWGIVIKDTIGDPRAHDAKLTGWKRRCYLAHLNSYEAAIGFVAAVLTAEFLHAPRLYLDSMAGVFVVLRLLYVYVYLTNHPYLRTTIFQMAIWLNLSIFFMAAFLGHAPT